MQEYQVTVMDDGALAIFGPADGDYFAFEKRMAEFSYTFLRDYCGKRHPKNGKGSFEDGCDGCPLGDGSFGRCPVLIKQAVRSVAWREFQYAEQHPEAISTSERVDTINHHLGRARIELMRLSGTGHEDEVAKMIIELTRMKERVKKLKEGKE